MIRFANVLGFLALALLLVQLLAPARGRLSGAPFRMTLLLRLHGPFGYVALALAVVHLLILALDDPDRLELLNVARAPARARDAVGAPIAAVSLALGHVAGVGRYLGLDAVSGTALALIPLAALAALYLRPEHSDGR